MVFVTRRVVGDVGCVRHQAIHASPRHLRAQFTQCAFVHVKRRDLSARAEQSVRQHASETTRGAGDDRYFAFQAAL
jgi:hypothetical protein